MQKNKLMKLFVISDAAEEDKKKPKKQERI